ncbi:ROK family protein, partial [Candidatus Aminicenantes bacterium AC-335-G13]|nr:ROK family protein [Candidatus Aminicenantes bacterium AC-335-G13]
LWDYFNKEFSKNIIAAGFGLPGIYNIEKKLIHQSPHLSYLDDYPIHETISEFINVPFFINNDANLAAWGEYKIGAGKNAESMVLLTIGTGVGSGIIMGGKLWQGKCGFAGELGHIIVNPEGEECECGGRGCLETEVCSTKIVDNYIKLKGRKEEFKKLTSKDVFERAKAGEKEALRAFSIAGYFLGLGLASIINFLNPEKIILGGGVMEAGDLLLKPALEEAKKRAYKKAIECCEIRKASLGNKAGIIGSALWAAENIKRVT